MATAVLTGTVARVGFAVIGSARGPRWDAAAPIAVVGMAVVACVIIGGVLLFLRPDARSSAGFAESVVPPQRSFPEDYEVERHLEVSREGPDAGPLVTDDAAVMPQMAAPTFDMMEPPGAVEAPEAPEGFIT